MSCNIRSMSKEEIELLLSTDFANGLDKDASIARIKKRKEGRLPERDVSFSNSLRSVFGKPSFFMFSFLIVLSFFMSSTIVCAFLVLSAVLFYSILLFKIHATKIDIYKYNKAFESSYNVLRGGKISKIKSSLLVEGDILFLKSGDVSPAYCYIVSHTEDFSSEGDTPLLYKGSRVLCGSCRCAICKIVEKGSSVSEKTGGAVSKIKKQFSMYSYCLYAAFLILSVIAFLRSSDGAFAFSTFAFFVIIIAGAIFEHGDDFLNILYRKIFLDNKEKNISSAINGVDAVEKISELDCICFEGDELFDDDNFSPKAFYCDSNLHMFDKICNNSFFEAFVIVENLLPSSNVKLDCKKHLSYYESRLAPTSSMYRLKDSSFSFDTVMLKNKQTSIAYVKGDLSRILNCCTRAFVNGKSMLLDDDAKDSILKKANEFLKRGYNVMAYANVQGAELSLESSQVLHKKMTFCGFLVCAKTVSSSGAELLSKCEFNDIQPLIFMNGELENIKRLFDESVAMSDIKIVDCRNAKPDASLARQLVSKYSVFLNSSEELRTMMLNVISKSGYKIGAVNSEKLVFLREAAYVIFDSRIGFDCNDKDMSCNSDVVLRYGVESLNNVFCKTEAFINKAEAVIEYSMISAFLKLAIFLISFFAGSAAFTDVQTALLTFWFDFAVIHLIIKGELETIYKNSEVSYTDRKIKKIVLALVGAAAVALASLVSFLINDISFSKNLVSVAFVFYVLFSSSYLLFNNVLSKKEKVIYYIWASVMFLLACVFLPFFGRIFGVGGDMSALVAAIVAFLVFLILKSIIKNI